jgi:putative sigma-54 modulation protein
MTVRVTARHFELTDGIKQHIENRSRHFERFVQNIVDLRWTLDIDKHRNIAEASALVHGVTLTGHAEAADLRSAIDDAAEKMEAQLRKYKDRIKEKDPKAIAQAKAAAMRNGEPSDD